MFLLPLATTIFLGQMFDLRNYSFKTRAVYDYDDVKSLTQLTDINEFSAEYMLIESEVEYRKFLGLDVATNLKALVNEYYYSYKTQLRSLMNDISDDKVHMALKISLRLVNETVPFDASQRTGWDTENSRYIGTHYVKSIIYGSEVFLLLSVVARNREHKAELKRSILSSVGRSGTLDESFEEKFRAVLEEHDTGYYHSFFGTVPYYAENVPAHNVKEMLELKKNLAEIVKMTNDGKGARLFYEMQPISLLSSKFPLVDINNEIIELLYDVEKKFEDLTIAYDEFVIWTYEIPYDISEEDELKIAAVYEEIVQARGDMVYAISVMDVSNFGSINQFSKAMSSYGNTTDTHKYRRKLELLQQQYPTR